jgi:hypothetical protein
MPIISLPDGYLSRNLTHIPCPSWDSQEIYLDLMLDIGYWMPDALHTKEIAFAVLGFFIRHPISNIPKPQASMVSPSLAGKAELH